MLRFEWDEEKNGSNRKRHGVWFEEAQSAFRDPNSRLFDDPGHSDLKGHPQSGHMGSPKKRP
jgi:uncharacterized DUF497 family protein